MSEYTITYWTGKVETINATSARDAASKFGYYSGHLNQYSVYSAEDDILDVYNEYWDHCATVQQKV